jgi:hypothetical protein
LSGLAQQRYVKSHRNLLRGCLKSPANAKFTERGTGFMPALRKLK